MEWVGKTFSSANADVRGSAVRVTKEVHHIVGPAVRRHLPKDLTPKMKEQLDAVLGGAEPEPPPQQQQQAAPARANRQQPAASKAAAAKAAPAPAQAKGKKPPEPAAASGDDPAPYLEEMAQRERQYGPSHPRVAETASNLAILYNQRGDAAAAQPLYERALRIYEDAYGPDHADVAHTLTDLAVLHMEQASGGDLAKGRLERTLFPDTVIHLDNRATRPWAGRCWNGRCRYKRRLWARTIQT